jgi:hypothetical protein
MVMPVSEINKAASHFQTSRLAISELAACTFPTKADRKVEARTVV